MYLVDPRIPIEYALLKLAAHAEDRLLERTQLNPNILGDIREDLRHADIPRGTHHVVLPDGSYAVLKDVSRGNRQRHVLATVLSPEMRPPGRDLTIDIRGYTNSGQARREVSLTNRPTLQLVEDRGARRESNRDFDTRAVHTSRDKKTPTARDQHAAFSKTKRGKDSVSHVETYSSRSVKVAGLVEDDIERVSSLRYDKDSLQDWVDILRTPFSVLEVDMNTLPRHEHPKNWSKETRQELNTIKGVMDKAPLDEDDLDDAAYRPLDMFLSACESLNLEPHEEITKALSDDLLKIALYLKYVYGRPRPYQLAPYYNISLGIDDLDPGNPSFPSGHALLGYGLANHYASIYPDHSAVFEDIGNKIALSRLQSGVHYPSDLRYSKALAQWVIPVPEEKTASILGAAAGAYAAGEGVKERAAGAAGGAVGGTVGNVVTTVGGLALADKMGYLSGNLENTSLLEKGKQLIKHPVKSVKSVGGKGGALLFGLSTLGALGGGYIGGKYTSNKFKNINKRAGGSNEPSQ